MLLCQSLTVSIKIAVIFIATIIHFTDQHCHNSFINRVSTIVQLIK